MFRSLHSTLFQLMGATLRAKKAFIWLPFPSKFRLTHIVDTRKGKEEEVEKSHTFIKYEWRNKCESQFQIESGCCSIQNA